MELLVRVDVSELSRHEDIRLTVLPQHPSADVAHSILRYLELPTGISWVIHNRRTGKPLESDSSVEHTDLVSGDVLDVSSGTSTRQASGARRLVVTAGTEVGRFVALERNSVVVVGTSPEADLSLRKETHLGRTQLTVQVDSSYSVRVSDSPNPKNCAELNGQPLGTSAVDARTGDVIRVANLELRLDVVSAPRSFETDGLGLVAFAPGPRQRPVVPSPEITSPDSLPTTPEPQRFQAITVALPLATGLGMAAVLGEPRYALFALLGPIGGIANHIEHSRRSGRKFKAEVQQFESYLKHRQVELEAARQAEARTRADLSPALNELRRRVRSNSRSLWNRKADHADRLQLRLGTGQVDASWTTNEAKHNGDEEFRQRLREQSSRFRQLADAPVTVRLNDVGCLAVVGEPLGPALAIARGLMVQAAAFNSPESLVVAAIAPPHADWYGSLHFLPHCRSAQSPLAGAHIAGDETAARVLLRRLDSIIRSRVASAKADSVHQPEIALLVDDRVEFDPAWLAPVLQNGPSVGVYIIFVTNDPGQVPSQAGAVVRARDGAVKARVWYSEEGGVQIDFDYDGASPELLDEFALSLAPLRDASAYSTTSAIPRTVRLFEALGIEKLDTAEIQKNWARPRTDSVVTRFGTSSAGSMSIDLVKHGPHSLIGGTSGSGKSELVQALVAGLVVENSPRHVQLMFIDFKGGSASSVFKDLPHVVGRITDLDEYLAERALESIRAELRARVALFADERYMATDLKDMIDRFPEMAPPSLVIVIDEFATLVKELPSFVTAIVDIAQRGRSYGIHLMLATQRPSTSVNENILANTNLRISLRMLDAAESMSLIGVPDACQIPVPLRGRAIARLGPNELVEFQSGYGGAPFTGDSGRPPVKVSALDAQPPDTEDDNQNAHGDTEMKRLCGAIESLEHPRVRPVWQDPIEGGVSLDSLLSRLSGPEEQYVSIDRPSRELWTKHPERILPLGIYDDPRNRSQYPALVDLYAAGGLAVVGSPGSGLTNLLQVIADIADRDPSTGLFALDFASGTLSAVRSHVSCVEYASPANLEAVTRIITKLDSVVTSRLSDTESSEGRVLLLIDGYSALEQSFRSSVRHDPGGELILSLLRRIVERGRSVGVFVCFTCDRTSTLPGWLNNAVSERILLRNSDDEVLKMHGEAPTRNFPPGAGFVRGLRIQIADARLSAKSEEAKQSPVHPSLSSEPLPAFAERAPSTAQPGTVEIGLDDVELNPTRVDLRRDVLTVSGPAESGKSTVLRLLAKELHSQNYEVYGIGPADCGLERSTSLVAGGFTPEDRRTVLAMAEAALNNAAKGTPVFLLVDDADRLDDDELDPFTYLLSGGRSLRLVGSVSRVGGSFQFSRLIKDLQHARIHLVLQPTSPQAVADAANLSQVPVLRPGLTMCRGRGVLVDKGKMVVVQVTLSTDEMALARAAEER